VCHFSHHDNNKCQSRDTCLSITLQAPEGTYLACDNRPLALLIISS